MELTDFVVEPTEEDIELALQIQKRAVHLLSLREHGAKELTHKLNQKFPQTENRPGLVDFVLEVCREKGWLSDERFIESYVRQAIVKGHGPQKIRQSLAVKTDASDMISAHLAMDDGDWVEIAQSVLEKKYGDCLRPSDRKEQARRMRFLQSRGFTQSQIYKAFKSSF